MPRNKRALLASPRARQTVYAVGVLLVCGIAFAAGRCREDSSRDLMIITGLLVGVAFVVSPITHNFYYMLMLPLVMALLDYSMARPGNAQRPAVWWLLLLFMAIDFVARLPGIGGQLRDWGAPLIGLLMLMVAGGMLLVRPEMTDALRR